MRKRLLSISLCVILLLSLAGCAKEYVLNQREASRMNYTNETHLIKGLPIKLALELYADTFRDQDTCIYVPVGGEYETKSGEKFTAVVSEFCGIHFLEDASHSRLIFRIQIYDSVGNLIIQKSDFCSYVQVGTKKPDLTYVSEEFREYWEIIAVRCDKLELSE